MCCVWHSYLKCGALIILSSTRRRLSNRSCSSSTRSLLAIKYLVGEYIFLQVLHVVIVMWKTWRIGRWCISVTWYVITVKIKILQWWKTKKKWNYNCYEWKNLHFSCVQKYTPVLLQITLHHCHHLLLFKLKLCSQRRCISYKLFLLSLLNSIHINMIPRSAKSNIFIKNQSVWIRGCTFYITEQTIPRLSRENSI